MNAPGPTIAGTSTDAPAPAPERHESVWGVLGVGLGILILLGAVGSLFSKRGGELDSQALLDSCFEPFEVPFGLEVRPGGKLPSGARFAVLARDIEEGGEEDVDLSELEGLDAEEPAGEESEASSDSDSSEEPKFDWTLFIAGIPAETLADTGAAPTRVLIADYPLGLAERVHEGHFRTLSWRDAKDLGNDGGRMTIATERLDWNGLQALYVHTRRFERANEEPRFRDMLHVCLATAEGYRVLYAFWPPGTSASLERTRELVGALRPVSS